MPALTCREVSKRYGSTGALDGEVVVLAGFWPQSAHLPEQPLQRHVTAPPDAKASGMEARQGRDAKRLDAQHDGPARRQPGDARLLTSMGPLKI